MPAAPPTGASGALAVSTAETRLGDVYVYGATGPSTFDCSGLMQWAYKQLGVHIPRTSEEQYAAGTPISAGQLQPGDLVFSAGSDGTTSHPGHVAMYVGERSGVPSVIEAPHTGARVRYTPLDAFGASGYRRMKGVATGGATDAGYTVPIPGVGNLPIPDPGGALGGLLSIPADIIGFFGKATDDLTALGKFFWAFTQPSTWVRIGAGYVGTMCLIAGIVFLILAGVQPT